MKRILICGVSYVGHAVHIRGAVSMTTSGFFENVGRLRQALENGDYDKTLPDPNRGEVLAAICGDPFIAVGSFGKGRSAAFTSDCAPHWGSPKFLQWTHYGRLWCNLAARLTEPSE